jgi:hypothetical protein
MRRPRSRPLAAAVAFALLAIPVAAFLIVRPDRPPARRRAAPPAAASTLRRAPAPAVGTATPSVQIGASRLAAARASARQFIRTYLAFLRRRGSIRSIAHAAPILRRALAREPVRVTPAQAQARPRLRTVTVAAEPGGSMRAVATLQDPAGPPYPLLLYLEPRARTWTVTRLGDL